MVNALRHTVDITELLGMVIMPGERIRLFVVDGQAIDGQAPESITQLDISSEQALWLIAFIEAGLRELGKARARRDQPVDVHRH